ncbi:hypothetical protein ACOI1H_13410 [Loktanella sp. DJP18]|uniref:hypothetical protein n=1 Tax=Loktanella sp. DJP18 TaxID=3409788 RepID=UPI003BB60C23
MSKSFSPDAQSTFLSAEDFANFRAAIDADPAPTQALVDTMGRYRAKIASGELQVAAADADDLAWFKTAFEGVCETRDAAGNASLAAENRALRLLHRDYDALSKDQRSAHHNTLLHVIDALATSGFTVTYPVTDVAAQEGPDSDYDADLELARHLIFDNENPTFWALEIFARQGNDFEKALSTVLAPILRDELNAERVLAAASPGALRRLDSSALRNTMARLRKVATEYPEGVFYALLASPDSMSTAQQDFARANTAHAAG